MTKELIKLNREIKIHKVCNAHMNVTILNLKEEVEEVIRNYKSVRKGKENPSKNIKNQKQGSRLSKRGKQ
jgi:hypothetical protein